MAEQSGRPGRVGEIDGEPAQFAAHELDLDYRRITVTVIQRGSRSPERLQRAMSGEHIAVTLPGDSDPYVTSPGSIDVTTSGAGEKAFHRVRLILDTVDDDHGDHPPGATDPPEGAAAPENNSNSLPERLARSEAKLDRVLSILDRNAKSP